MNIGKVIYKKISELTITGFASTNIFPNIIKSGIEFPAVVYEITEQLPIAAKGQVSRTDIFSVNLYTYSKNYDQLIDISDLIRAEIDGTHNESVVISQSETINIDSIIFNSSHQSFDDMAKVHIIIDSYTIRVKL